MHPNAPLTLREATLADGDLLLEWRNDPETRAASRDTNAIDRERHFAWLQQSLNYDERVIFVAEIGHIPVGTVRIDWSIPPELSWTVAPASRGQRIGRQMVEAVIQLYVHERLVAVTRADNIASRRIAESAGFEEVCDDGSWITFERRHTLNRVDHE